MYILAVEDTVWLAIIAAVVALLTPMVTAWSISKQSTKIDKTNESIAATNVSLAKTNESMKEVKVLGELTHEAANTNFAKSREENTELKRLIKESEEKVLALSTSKATVDAELLASKIAAALAQQQVSPQHIQGEPQQGSKSTIDVPATASITLTTKETGTPVFAEPPEESKK